MAQTKKSAAEAAALLEEIRGLMVLKGENPFKVRAFEKAVDVIGACDDVDARARAGTLTELAGIGKGISEVLTEFCLHGTSKARDELAAGLPPGLAELTQVPGLGPKKAQALIEELGIRSVAELEYACRENRLLKLKGFGDKLQHKILEGIVFMNGNRGQQRLDEAFAGAEGLCAALARAVNGERHPAGGDLRVSEAGELRRRLETLRGLDFLIEVPAGEKAALHARQQAEGAVERYRAEHAGMLPVALHFAPGPRFGYELARLTASPAHWQALGQPAAFDAPSEDEFYARLALPVIPPETRETGEEVALARAGKLSGLLPWNGVRGVFHNHTTRSDGAHSLEEMVAAAEKLGYEYIGISDHSQSAFYAQGLKVDGLAAQEREIREVQARHPGIRVFWGIESDILADGSLDYDDRQLRKFDFVIASIHSRFEMDQEAMTDRILSALRHPCTRFLGHATGRLLLGRKGYAVHMEKLIREAAERDVAIEINANPARLDIDWRWGPELRKRGTSVSVNPDAHEIAGLEDTRYGIAMARKALLPVGQVINARPAKDVEKWLRRA